MKVFFFKKHYVNRIPVCAKKKGPPTHTKRCVPPGPPESNVGTSPPSGADHRCEKKARSCSAAPSMITPTLDSGGPGADAKMIVVGRRAFFSHIPDSS